MSCGDPHDVDCTAVLEEVYLYLDGELEPAQREQIRVHLQECAPCLRLFGIEQEVKALVARCCGNDVAPPQLRAKVLATLRSVSLQTASGSLEVSSLEVRYDGPAGD